MSAAAAADAAAAPFALQGIVKYDRDIDEVSMLTNRVSSTSGFDANSEVTYANDLAMATDGRVFFTSCSDIVPTRTPEGYYDTFKAWMLGLAQVCALGGGLIDSVGLGCVGLASASFDVVWVCGGSGSGSGGVCPGCWWWCHAGVLGLLTGASVVLPSGVVGAYSSVPLRRCCLGEGVAQGVGGGVLSCHAVLYTLVRPNDTCCVCRCHCLMCAGPAKGPPDGV
jgi:hypothetical protein